MPVLQKVELEKVVDYVISKYPQKILEFRAGVRSSFDFLVKESLKLTDGKADPAKIRALILAKM
jgi:aspartyl-tRNA(Asn)/glutamyl-tRNA(Gln) amidotransferase subunit B